MSVGRGVYTVESRQRWSNRFGSRLEDGLFSDLEIFCEQNVEETLLSFSENKSNSNVRAPILAHKAIVASQSEVIRDLIDESGDDGKSAIVLQGISRNVMKSILQFLYEGKIRISDGNVVSLFEAASNLAIISLQRLCEEHVSSAISIDTVFLLYETAVQFEAVDLEKQCEDFFKKHVSAISAAYRGDIPRNFAIDLDAEKESDGFSQNSKKRQRMFLETQTDMASLEGLSETSLIKLLCKNFIVKEINVFHLVVHWGLAQQGKLRKMGHNRIPQLSEILTKVIRYVRLISISRADLEDVVFPMGIVPFRMISETLFAKLNNRYRVEPGRHTEDRNARDQDGGPLRFYLLPRENCWLTLKDFEHEGQYAEYCKSVLREGMRMRAVGDYENVQRGDLGEFVQHNSGYPPCQVRWEAYANTYWLYWRDLEIIG